MAGNVSTSVPLDQPRFVSGPLGGNNSSDMHPPGSGEFTPDAMPPTIPSRAIKGDLPLEPRGDGGAKWSLHNPGLPWTTK